MKVMRWKPSTDVTELFPPQAFLLREQGGAGQLGDGHHQDEGRMTFNGDINTRVRDALMQELGEAILMSRARSDFRSVGGSILRLTLVTVVKPKNTHTLRTHPPFPFLAWMKNAAGCRP